MKKILAIIIAIVMVVTLMPAALAATWTADAPTVALSASNADADGIIEVTVSVSSSDMIGAYTLAVEYDPAMVDVADGFALESNDPNFARKNFNMNTARSITASGYKLFVITDAATDGITNKGFTAKMYFHAKNEGTTVQFRLSDSIINGISMFRVAKLNGDAISFPTTGTSASVVIPDNAAQPVPIEITSIKCVNGAVVLEWAGADGVDGYRVHKKVGSGKWTTALASTTATTFTDTAVEVGKKYTYAIRSFVGSTYSTGYNETAKSITVTAAAVEPQPIEITSIKCVNGAVVLEWAGQDGVDGYRVHKKVGTGKWTTALASTTATTFTDTDVQTGKKYTYAIRSFVGSTYSTGYNETAKSITVTAAAVEPQPIEITSIKCVNGAVVLEWAGQDGVDGYRVHKKVGSGKWTTAVAATTATTFTDTDVQAGKKYTYAVRSYVGSTYSTGYNETAKSITVS
ncbi:MAG: hypothetical protein IKD89_05620 [Clostridia bacterium]|nr:hypothetical protein [Clostridia bacterium]